MNRIRVLAVACCFVIPSFAADARSTGKTGGSCANPEQIQAAQLRQLHNQLQVAALNCRGEDSSLHAKWGGYVGRFGSTLSDNAQVLRTHFKSAAAFDRYNTQVTNRESVRVHEVDSYCETRAQIFDQVMTMSPPQLIAFAGQTVGRPDHIPDCATRTTKAASKTQHNSPKKNQTAQAN
ncbi:hypothetical protein [Magnetospirillum molischianum]|uniref:Putative Large exoproteins involved in heme utilization or adhesion n=1 Tax=Magnetospirillum molischianum DSM 120 TaxID=1150626 RepID=H8FW84_MAGML|nr:hypothetical protein [Magnetospirillum molischianum]CCG42622.1 putative Large exoproteins involved in heme utilization or adhesion [Magnetospirillum molischianum DSM 120]